MNGFRVARKYIERLTDKDLQELYQVTLRDDSQEALTILYLIICEMRKRQK